MAPRVRFIRRGRGRLARAVVIALVVLAESGAAATLALLPSYPGSAVAERSHPVALRPELAAGLASVTAVRTPLRGVLRAARHSKPRRPGRAYYRRIAARHVAAAARSGFMPLYQEAARTFGVSWQLIASIHRQETAFSAEPSTYHGLNPFGCCAGPMQFNVENGPVTTWDLYRESFRLGRRPRHYPHPTGTHPSVYDDFDAIMAAGALLRDSGATQALDGGAWSAAYAYYGHDRFGIDYASQVVGRAIGWQRTGFCLNCPLDGSLVAGLTGAYGPAALAQLRAAAAARRRHKHAKHKRHGTAGGRPSQPTETHRAPRPSSAGDDAQTPPLTQVQTIATPPPPATTPVPAATTPQPPPEQTTPTPPPPSKDCTGVHRLLGCGG